MWTVVSFLDLSMEPSKRYAVVYCDGSCKPNPGFGGFGVFGYTYSLYDGKKKVSTKYIYKPTHHFTEKGIHENNPQNNIIINDIIEMSYYITRKSTTNNKAELLAFEKTLEYIAANDDIESVLIYTDSSYVCTAYNENISSWIKSDWKRLDGKEIVHKEDWTRIIAYRDILFSRGTKIDVQWVKSHGENIGNQLADYLSCIGSNAAKIHQDKLDNEKDSSIAIMHLVTPFKEYNTTKDDKDIVYQFKDVFFSSNEIDDKTYCFLFNANKNQQNIGCKSTESIFAINIGYLPKVINDIKAFHRSMQRTQHKPCCIKLSKLKDPMLLRLTQCVDISYLLQQEDHKNTFNLIRDTTPFVFDVDQYTPMISNVGSIFDSMIEIHSNSPWSNKQTFKVSIYDRFYENKKLKITNREDIFDITDVVRKIIETSDTQKPYFIQKLNVELGKDLPSYLAMKYMEDIINDLEIIVAIDNDTNLMTCIFNFILQDRNLLVTNITNKFVMKLLVG